MADRKIVVPDEALVIASSHVRGGFAEMAVQEGVRKFALWLSENPIVPTVDQAQEVWDYCSRGSFLRQEVLTEWQRRMFLAPESKAPEPMDPQKCPHRWQRRDDLSTMERVVYCELCGWVYSRDAIGDCPCYPRSMESK